MSDSTSDILMDRAAWDTYREAFASSIRVPSSLLTWGQGPEVYPCLVCAALHGNRVRCCYVYLDDARALLRAAGEAAEEHPQDLKASEAKPDMLEWRKHVNANLRAIVNELIAVGVTTEDRYERTLAKYIADVDQETASQYNALTRVQDDDARCEGK